MTNPDLSGVKMAIGGGAILIHQGKLMNIKKNVKTAQRHPRSAVCWNEKFLFLMVVDGRQKGLSEGMTLPELANYLRGLGCDEAINMDGGGSSTLWYNGQVINSPSDNPGKREERKVANALVIVHQP